MNSDMFNKAATAPAKKASAVPWVEKYRPKTVDDVAHQDEVVSTLKKSLESGNLPHLLFYGPPGTGKTSTILAIARQLYGPELMKSRVMELNASDERGINVVRTKVKTFARVSAGAMTIGDRKVPPYKLIILDEADSMTSDAQSALRRTMETYTKVTRFCLICNYVSRIIDPIASRCAKFRFKSLQEETMHARINHICSEEGIVLTPEALRALSDISGGDLRKAITLLQSAYRLNGANITKENLVEISGLVPREVVVKFMDVCRTESFEKVQEEVTELIANAYPVNSVVAQLFDEMKNDKALSGVEKAAIAQEIARADEVLTDGGDEMLQLLQVASVIRSQFSHHR
eukprot:TRINITY_DN5263_c0_g2_i1.p1 TRINITY_DN5263_c0_g2~~TRINITY_DN5263_c0_g2_i1.p1  ORF type:complete len:346 (-),score=61.87 TRINITY_DN5263_c0_g2_i1:69-1106(-)